MDPLKCFRSNVVRTSLGAVAASAAALCLLDVRIGGGVVLGGVASTAAFWLSASAAGRFVARTAETNAARAGAWSARKWAVGRLAVYALMLRIGFELDPAGLRGFWGVAAGLFIGQLAVRIIAYIGRDLGKPVDKSQESAATKRNVFLMPDP